MGRVGSWPPADELATGGDGANIRCSKLLRQQMKLAITELALVEWHLEMEGRNFDAFLAGLVDVNERG